MLRPYQTNAISDLREAYREHKRILLVMPTGSGKTVVFSQICASAIDRDKTVLILSHRTEIFLQSVKAMSKHDIPVCKIDPDSKAIYPGAKLFIGMVETFKRRLERYRNLPIDLIILDEAHGATFNSIMDAFPNTKVLGCTASPVGKHLYKYYTKLVQSIDIPELIEEGFLCENKGFEMQDDFSDLEKDKSGEFTDESQYKHFSKSKIYQGVIDQWKLKAIGTKTLCFCVNIEHANETCEAFNESGIKAFCITSKTSKEQRDWTLNEFKRGVFPVLVNANILIAGYDEPSIQTIIMNRATTSLILWLQACGRGSRPHPGKEIFIVLDFGGNYSRHGLWSEARKWELKPPKKSRATIGIAPVKSCPKCQAILAAMAKQCRYCNHVFEPTAKELAEGKLVEVTNAIRSAIPGRYLSELTVPELIELEKTKVIKSTYCWRILRSRGAIDLADYARIKEYKDAWVVRQLEAMDHEVNDGKKTLFFDKKINEVPLINA